MFKIIEKTGETNIKTKNEHKCGLELSGDLAYNRRAKVGNVHFIKRRRKSIE